MESGESGEIGGGEGKPVARDNSKVNFRGYFLTVSLGLLNSPDYAWKRTTVTWYTILVSVLL